METCAELKKKTRDVFSEIHRHLTGKTNEITALNDKEIGFIKKKDFRSLLVVLSKRIKNKQPVIATEQVTYDELIKTVHEYASIYVNLQSKSEEVFFCNLIYLNMLTIQVCVVGILYLMSPTTQYIQKLGRFLKIKKEYEEQVVLLEKTYRDSKNAVDDLKLDHVLDFADNADDLNKLIRAKLKYADYFVHPKVSTRPEGVNLLQYPAEMPTSHAGKMVTSIIADMNHDFQYVIPRLNGVRAKKSIVPDVLEELELEDEEHGQKWAKMKTDADFLNFSYDLKMDQLESERNDIEYIWKHDVILDNLFTLALLENSVNQTIADGLDPTPKKQRFEFRVDVLIDSTNNTKEKQVYLNEKTRFQAAGGKRKTRKRR